MPYASRRIKQKTSCECVVNQGSKDGVFRSEFLVDRRSNGKGETKL